MEINQQEGIFHIYLLPDCDIYHGHFPGHPVCPGVCHIEIIKECAMRLTGKKLSITDIKQCRFINMATPSICQEIDVTVNVCPVEEGFKITARISEGIKSYVEFKGLMTV